MKEIVILGSTGSIGKQTLDVVRSHPDKFSVKGLACGSRIDVLLEQIIEFRPDAIYVEDEGNSEIVKDRLLEFSKKFASEGDRPANHFTDKKELDNLQIYHGEKGLTDIASLSCDVTVNALVGINGLKPTIAAINRGNDIALANKETLVAGGEIIMKLAAENRVEIFPIDSEHSAIYQCLEGRKKEDVSKLLLTGSGGPFREYSRDELKKVTKKEALKHPKWNMGEKITIDSATLMNKGLELIEAKWLFDIAYKNIEVLIHPQSIIHSMVEFIDGTVIAQMGPTDMRLPIAYALSAPGRYGNNYGKLDFFKEGSRLEFLKPDIDKFPCLYLAIEAIKTGGTAPAVLNGGNEELVSMFLSDKIKFFEIPEILDVIMNETDFVSDVTLENVLFADNEARKKARSIARQRT